MNELAIYLGRIRQFRRVDWIVYAAWVGLMVGLCLATGGFVWAGHRASAPLPAEASLLPLGAAIFTLAIAVVFTQAMVLVLGGLPAWSFVS